MEHLPSTIDGRASLLGVGIVAADGKDADQGRQKLTIKVGEIATVVITLKAQKAK